MKSISITRRLVGTILILELLSAIVLIAVIAAHERHVQTRALDASLVAGAQSLMGSVQDAEDKDDNVLLDLRTIQIAKNAIYRVQDELGRVLGATTDAGSAFESFSSEPGFHNLKLAGQRYRFYTLHGVRIIDPGDAIGGKRHTITIVYGVPAEHVEHEVFEEIRFLVIATALLFGVTTFLIVGVIRRRLAPVRELAVEANRINSGKWLFDAPQSAKQTVELQPLAGALESALERVHRSFEQQRRFTSDAAHELKTDVAIVKSSLQLLAMRKRSVEEYAAGLTLGLQDFTRLEETVHKLLTLARLEQSEMSPSDTQPHCSLREAAEEAMHQSSPLAQLRSVTVAIDSADDAQVPVDRRDAVLLCSNLIVNAIQHSPEAGKVLLSLAPQNGKISFTVRDWGEGISEEDRPHLFHPFYRTDVSRSRKSGGTGLGLSICKAICNRAGGTIEIANHREGGAQVTVILPVVAT